jgi:hypothetical protein
MHGQQGAVGGLVAIYWVFVIALGILTIVAMWRVFQKAGQPGWAAIVPIYNAYILLKTVGRPGWWVVLYLIPIVNVVIEIIVLIDLAKCFGQGGGFAVGLFFLPFIFMPILGFGSAQYRPIPRPTGTATPATGPA